MNNRILASAAALALLSLAACGEKQPEVVDTRAADPMAEQLKNATAVELPPAIEKAVTFRCQPGNSLIYVDFFQGRKLANLRTEKTGTPTQLKAPESGQPFVGGGYTIDGTPTSIKYTAPGKSALTCKA
ncbi:hypothetical protein ACFSC3_03200 [Sphingomonas floccifaciens]|uniref:C-type lysozyme inhibitor domain-containing protein n=1 Tax=Sphingomonas floccifaciens TaxID=1844115 RepID=A0ABW4N927_9SPHN